MTNHKKKIEMAPFHAGPFLRNEPFQLILFWIIADYYNVRNVAITNVYSVYDLHAYLTGRSMQERKGKEIAECEVQC